MEIFGNTDIGRQRDNNEDSFRCGALEDGTLWGVVCDGMGGAAGGEVASKIAADMVSEKITKCYRRTFEMPTIRNMLFSAIVTANVSIMDAVELDSSLKGMGTTIVAAIVKDNVALIANVGDSRAYLINESGAKQITHDHSLVQAMLDSGQITLEEYETSSIRNIILKCLGTEEIKDNDYIDYYAVFLNEGDAILLCSDGLSNCVNSEQLQQIVLNADGARQCTQQLIETANENGGNDNITAVVIK